MFGKEFLNRIVIIYILFIVNNTFANETDTTAKRGWELGGILPMLAYDSDMGLRYGALAEIYDYGKGEFLPDYKQKFYLEFSLSTKGNATHQLTFDSKNLLGTEMRLTGEVNYVTEKALDFYGFNGVENGYNPEYENTESSEYKSRMYYRLEREMLRIAADFHFNIRSNEIKFFAGMAFFNIGIGSVNINELNEGKDAGDLLPSTDSVPGLYEILVNTGVIPEDDKPGGSVFLFRIGATYDTRDNESFPTDGSWAEVFMQGAPVIKKHSGYSQFIATLRQYYSLSSSKNAVFAYRLAYTARIGGEIPFYMLPFYFNTTETRDGFGSGKTIRGISRDRLVADAVLFGNLEFRWKFLAFSLFGRNFYSALGLFFDTGIAVSDYKPGIYSGVNGTGSSGGRFHNSLGAGLHCAMNDNFILTMDLGKALNKSDGNFGFYIHMNWLF